MKSISPADQTILSYDWSRGRGYIACMIYCMELYDSM